jgi:glycine cleavage system H protein
MLDFFPTSSIKFPASSLRSTVVNPDKLLFAKTHEWVSIAQEGAQKVATVGISAFAVEALTDLVFIELPKVGRQVSAEQSFCEVESVKAVSDIYAPVTGEVIAVNDTLPDHLETLSSDPYGKGWIAKIRVNDDSNIKNLLDHAAYQEMCAEETH